MSLAASAAPRRLPSNGRGLIFWGLVLAFVVALSLAGDLVPWALEYPRAWEVPLRFWISDFMKWLINHADLGLFTFKELTRSIAWLLKQPFDAANGLLASGFKLVFGADDEIVYQVPRISWVAVVAVVVMLGAQASGWRLALLIGVCFLYLVIFGQWDSAMITLSSIVVAVPLGVVGGLLIGIWGARSPRTLAREDARTGPHRRTRKPPQEAPQSRILALPRRPARRERTPWRRQG